MKVIDVSARYQGGFKTPRKSTDYLILHHAAAIYRDGPTALRVIEDWHVNHNGWSGIGYQEILAEETWGGEIVCYIISNPNLQRAHIGGQNDTMFGLCCATNFDDVRYFPDKVPTEKWKRAIVERMKYHKTVYTRAKVEGHKDKALAAWPSDCPGQKWKVWKPEILARIAAQDDLVINGVLVEPVFVDAYKKSGGVWEGVGILTPGVPLGPAFDWQGAKYQLFERSGLRHTEASGVEWMFQSEVETLNRERSS